MPNALRLLEAALAVSFAGAGLVRAGLAGTPLAGRALRISLGALAGLAAYSCSYAVALFALGPSARVMLSKDILLIAAGALALLAGAPKRAPGPPPDRVLLVLFAAAAVIVLTLFVEHSLRYPDGGEDAWGIWNLRARWLARAGPGFLSAFSPKLLFWTHQDYPLLLPGLVAQGFLAAGESPAVPALVALLFAGASVATLASAIAALRGPGQGLAAGLALLTTPCFLIFAANQQADVPLGSFELAAAALVALGLASDAPRSFVLAGFFASAGGWTKNEGAVDALALFAALLITSGPGRTGRAIRFALGALPIALLVAWFKLDVAAGNDLVRFNSAQAAVQHLADGARWLELGLASLRRLFYFQNWGFYLIALAVLVAARFRQVLRDRTAATLAVSVALSWVVLAAMYQTQPHPLLWFFRASIDRMLNHSWPTVLLIAALVLPGAPGPPPTEAHDDFGR